MVMKVLMVTHADRSVNLLLAAQIRALERAGYIVHVACADGKSVPSLLASGFQIKPLEIVNRFSPLVNLRSLLALYRLMRQERYDVVHVHMIAAAVIGRLAACLARVPLVFYTFRGFAFSPHSPWWVKFLNVMVEYLCRPLTDFVFSQSEENRQRAITYRVIDPERSLTVGNGVPVDQFHDERLSFTDAIASVRAELGIPPSAVVVGMVSRLLRDKGLVEFLEAAVQVSRVVPQAYFLHVGDTPPLDQTGFGREFQQRVSQNGLRPRFVFAGFRSDVARVYHAMDVFVLPSYHEGMPRSILEAMASGKPVVATDIAGCRDEVVHGETGLLVPVGDAEALSQAILTLLRDPDLARRMGQAGQQRAKELFDERVVCERIVSAYHRLVEEKFRTCPNAVYD
jgi:glycosyltransferase involved in cell wall biosynthesis